MLYLFLVPPLADVEKLKGVPTATPVPAILQIFNIPVLPADELLVKVAIVSRATSLPATAATSAALEFSGFCAGNATN